jgi:hypothetical protein
MFCKLRKCQNNLLESWKFHSSDDQIQKHEDYGKWLNLYGLRKLHAGFWTFQFKLRSNRSNGQNNRKNWTKDLSNDKLVDFYDPNNLFCMESILMTKELSSFRIRFQCLFMLSFIPIWIITWPHVFGVSLIPSTREYVLWVIPNQGDSQ